MLKWKKEIERFDCLISLPTVPQVRMTRRLVGEYELDEREAYESFYDTIGVTGDRRKREPVFEIPYSCL